MIRFILAVTGRPLLIAVAVWWSISYSSWATGFLAGAVAVDTSFALIRFLFRGPRINVWVDGGGE